MPLSDANKKRLLALWLQRPEDKRCVVDVMLFEEQLRHEHPEWLEGVAEPYKFLMGILWENIIDKRA